MEKLYAQEKYESTLCVSKFQGSSATGQHWLRVIWVCVRLRSGFENHAGLGLTVLDSQLVIVACCG